MANWQDVLAQQYPERQPVPSEQQFFQRMPQVGGYAADDGSVVLNPFSSLLPHEKQAVATNERLRQHLRNTKPDLQFPVLEHQANYFAAGPYANNPRAQQETILSRYLTGDPSGAPYSMQQQEAAHALLQSITNPSVGPYRKPNGF